MGDRHDDSEAEKKFKQFRLEMGKASIHVYELNGGEQNEIMSGEPKSTSNYVSKWVLSPKLHNLRNFYIVQKETSSKRKFVIVRKQKGICEIVCEKPSLNDYKIKSLNPKKPLDLSVKSVTSEGFTVSSPKGMIAKFTFDGESGTFNIVSGQKLYLTTTIVFMVAKMVLTNLGRGEKTGKWLPKKDHHESEDSTVEGNGKKSEEEDEEHDHHPKNGKTKKTKSNGSSPSKEKNESD
eukprot:TRINITY_DN8689_c0_g1_i1.p1 TRINITY_DN8689_c0_g1~~TRINITY_DN8689_c0_g1_i1.p1  ORF type:complete len:236 (-),score=47.88 TRINITY_DN8689_c0_g1_i1:69-776(-)